jgi:predicted transcriptional regulator
MKRTTIFADESLLKSLHDIAQRERSSLAAVIRHALEDFVGRRQGTGALPFCAGIARSGRKDIAERAEELLWTSPHPKRKS